METGGTKGYISNVAVYHFCSEIRRKAVHHGKQLSTLEHSFISCIDDDDAHFAMTIGGFAPYKTLQMQQCNM